MAIQLKKEDIEGNTKLANQIKNQLGLVDEVDEGENIPVSQLRLDYAEDWALKHPILSILINILLNTGGYDEENIEIDRTTK